MDVPHRYKAYVRKVIDGNLVVMDIDCGFQIFYHSEARLLGIKAPKLEPKPERNWFTPGAKVRLSEKLYKEWINFNADHKRIPPDAVWEVRTKPTVENITLGNMGGNCLVANNFVMSASWLLSKSIGELIIVESAVDIWNKSPGALARQKLCGLLSIHYDPSMDEFSGREVIIDSKKEHNNWYVIVFTQGLDGNLLNVNEEMIKSGHAISSPI